MRHPEDLSHPGKAAPCNRCVLGLDRGGRAGGDDD